MSHVILISEDPEWSAPLSALLRERDVRVSAARDVFDAVAELGSSKSGLVVVGPGCDDADARMALSGIRRRCGEATRVLLAGTDREGLADESSALAAGFSAFSPNAWRFVAFVELLMTWIAELGVDADDAAPEEAASSEASSDQAADGAAGASSRSPTDDLPTVAMSDLRDRPATYTNGVRQESPTIETSASGSVSDAAFSDGAATASHVASAAAGEDGETSHDESGTPHRHEAPTREEASVAAPDTASSASNAASNAAPDTSQESIHAPSHAAPQPEHRRSDPPPAMSRTSLIVERLVSERPSSRELDAAGLARLLRMARHEDYFTFLDIDRSAAPDSIALACERLSDKLSSERLEARLEERFYEDLRELRATVADARAVLLSSEARRLYLDGLRRGPAPKR